MAFIFEHCDNSGISSNSSFEDERKEKKVENKTKMKSKQKDR